MWNLVFGTFVCEPSRVQARLGLDDPTTYPEPEQFHATLMWLFRSSALPATPAGAAAS